MVTSSRSTKASSGNGNITLADVLLESGCLEVSVELLENVSWWSALITEGTITPSSLIKRYINPGTTILSDRWKGYTHLNRHGYIHLTVNHRRGFIDPATGVHTNTCEGMWYHAKRHTRGGHGRTRTDSAAMDLALCEFMWLKRFNLTRSDVSVRKSFNFEIPELMKRTFG